MPAAAVARGRSIGRTVVRTAATSCAPHRARCRTGNPSAPAPAATPNGKSGERARRPTRRSMPRTPSSVVRLRSATTIARDEARIRVGRLSASLGPAREPAGRAARRPRPKCPKRAARTGRSHWSARNGRAPGGGSRPPSSIVRSEPSRPPARRYPRTLRKGPRPVGSTRRGLRMRRGRLRSGPRRGPLLRPRRSRRPRLRRAPPSCVGSASTRRVRARRAHRCAARRVDGSESVVRARRRGPGQRRPPPRVAIGPRAAGRGGGRPLRRRASLPTAARAGGGAAPMRPCGSDLRCGARRSLRDRRRGAARRAGRAGRRRRSP